MHHRIKSKPAYATVFAFIMMTILLIYVSSMAAQLNNQMEDNREDMGAADAYIAAQSTAEFGILAMKDYKAGYEVDTVEKAFCLYADGTSNYSGDGDCATWGDYTVYSKAAVNTTSTASYSGMFFTPIPGTGTAGNSDDCSISNDHEDEDHPCNWNKLMYGDSVTIPLYSDDGSGGIAVPADLGLDGWYLRVRTPCENGDLDDSGCARYEFDETDSTGTFSGSWWAKATPMEMAWVIRP